MTQRLYYHDSYLREFKAHLLKSTETDQGFEVVFDQTAFYPTSGGQPHDLGAVEGVRILDVFENEAEEIIHRLTHPVGQADLDCHIDWDRRFDHMQQHTGQHVLSQAFVRAGRQNTVGFHMGADYVTIDLDSETADLKLIHQAEKLANNIVFDNRPIKVQIFDPGETSHLGLRKESNREGPLRVVEVEDFDVSACGGTHVEQTGEIGSIVIRKVERVSRQIRVEFVCGQRALAAQRDDLQNLTSIARQFSVGLREAPARVEKQIEETRQLRKILQAKNKTLAGLLAKELYARAAEHRGFRLIKQVFEDEEMEFLKQVAQSALTQGPCVVLIGAKTAQANLVFAESEALPGDLRLILRDCCLPIEGKGGGTRTFVQAGGKNPAGVENALDLATTKVLALSEPHDGQGNP